VLDPGAGPVTYKMASPDEKLNGVVPQEMVAPSAGVLVSMG
jgi:hypothetical protein